MRQAYDEIKRRIITLELAPGRRIDDIELAEALELSRTPVREALFLLGSEGLIIMRNRAGFTVRALDLADIADLFELHVVMAKAVARLAAVRATDEDIEALAEAAARVDRAIDARDHLEVTRANAALHRREAVAAHNDHFLALANSVHDHGERLAYLCFGGEREWGRLDDYFAKVKIDHACLVDAYRRHAVVEAEQLATAHVRQFMRRVQAWMESEGLEDFVLTEEDLPPDPPALATPSATESRQDGLERLLHRPT
jgi:DNA-binding GntR family transcriptional regulator